MRRRRHKEWRPLVAVVGVVKRAGTGGIIHVGRKTTWWELTLTCGHVMERGIGTTRTRPAPKRARCDLCGCRARGTHSQ